jgi:hypothetical protein
VIGWVVRSFAGSQAAAITFATRSLAQALSPADADAADRHRDSGPGRFDDRDPDGLFEITAVVTQPAANIDHAGEGRVGIGEFDDPETDWQIGPATGQVSATRPIVALFC